MSQNIIQQVTLRRNILSDKVVQSYIAGVTNNNGIASHRFENISPVFRINERQVGEC